MSAKGQINFSTSTNAHDTLYKQWD